MAFQKDAFQNGPDEESLLGDMMLGDDLLGGGDQAFQVEEEVSEPASFYGHAQSQAQIKTTYYVHGQSQARIKQVYFAVAQAQALIGNKYNQHGQAEAWIKNTYFGLGQAQGTVKQIYYAHGQAQAQIGTLNYVHGQAESWIKTTYYQHGQSQGQIKQTYYVHGQAQGEVAEEAANPYGHGQAQATITAQYYQLLDTFDNRAFGPFSGSTQNPFSPLKLDMFNYPNTGQYTGVFLFDDHEIANDRLEAVLTSGGSTYLETIVQASDITTYFDFFANTYGAFAYHEIFYVNETGSRYADGYYNQDDAVFGLDFDDGNVEIAAPPLEDGEAYRFMFHMGNGTYRIKLWKLSDPEPSDWTLEVAHSSMTAARVQFGVNWDDPATAIWVDNATVLIPQVPIAQRYGQAQAYMLGYTQKYGQARARIKKTDNFRSGQAQARIRLNVVHGQARARIKTEGVNRFAQAQAFILNPGKVHGQAQARIHRPEGYGQAQARILTSYAGNVAQANAYIIEHHRWFGQAQAQILLTGTQAPRGYGQAQASIHRPQGYGQAQGYIYSPIEVVVLDTFTRTIAYGVIPGTPDVGPAYNTVNNGFFDITEYGNSEVDGSNYILEAENTIDDMYWHVNAHIPISVQDITATIDFKVPVLSDWMTLAQLYLRTHPTLQPQTSVYIMYNPDDDNTYVELYDSTSFPYPNTTIAAIEADTWYTVKLSAIGVDIKTKIWKRSDPEPGTWLIEATIPISPIGGGIMFYADIGETLGTITQHFDNLNAYVINVPTGYASGQAQALIKRTPNAHGQTQALIKRPQGYGQAQAYIKGSPKVHGQARAFISKSQGSGQAQAYIAGEILSRSGQAQAYISRQMSATGQARAFIAKGYLTGQAQARILAFGQIKRGNAQALIKRTANTKSGQAQAFILTKGGPAFGQAAALIASQKYLTRFNNYDLPGYAQEEVLESTQSIFNHEAEYEDNPLAEYYGLRNKILTLRMKTVGETYEDTKEQVQLAYTMLRSKKGWTKLYLQNTDKYYVAMTSKISTEKAVGESMRMLDYIVTFETKPWLISDATYSINGTGTITTVGRDYSHGGWTPATISVDGTNVTVSGYSAAGFAGYFAASGTVTNLVIDSEAYTATVNGENVNEIMFTPNYQTFVGPGETTFVVTGATRCEITWNNRWYL